MAPLFGADSTHTMAPNDEKRSGVHRKVGMDGIGTTGAGTKRAGTKGAGIAERRLAAEPVATGWNGTTAKAAELVRETVDGA
jgi:hypothetical protein